MDIANRGQQVRIVFDGVGAVSVLEHPANVPVSSVELP